VTNTWEEEGTFTNIRGRVQRFLQARTAPGVARPTWFVLGDLLGAMGDTGDYHLPSDVFAALASSRPAFAGLEYEALGLHGLPIIEQTLASAATVAGASV
jgi:predicted molibdopterin-dependent oxidoreductase YjgC